MRIKQLSSSVSNQIAAGEVIERPASVVKELVENAVDAGATALIIEIGFGGLNLIKVADNGHGIYAEDLELAIAAHATSKISKLTDLYTITTMGFRGEALASIAAVSRMEIHSKPADQAHGMCLKIDEFGVQTQILPRNLGTSIEIRDLFYNIPVRKTFLKSERLEYQAIELVVKQFALSAPHIAIKLFHNQKLTLQLPAADCESRRLSRIKKLFGQAFLNDAILIQETQAQVTIQGWISQLTYQRSQRDKQWVYLNNRLIKDKLILQAIGQAYQDRLHPGRYPSCILYLTLAPDQVDINVHPTKYEVRFRDPRTIHALMVAGLANRLPVPDTQSQPTPAWSKPGPISASADRMAQENTEWLILNSQFAILSVDSAPPYLLDLLALQHHYVKMTLPTTTVPLPYRALLVPVRIPLRANAVGYLQQQRSALANLGLQFDLSETEYIHIRSVPLSLPWLDLERFFLSIQTSPIEESALLDQLISCQTFDAYHLSAIDRETLVEFCRHHWDRLLSIPVCVRLDIATCQQLIAAHPPNDPLIKGIMA